MSLLVLYLLLAKATLTSFSGVTSIPVIQHDLVQTHHVLTDRQLNAAVAAGQTAPGPNGLFVVSVGYFVGGVAGGCAGLVAVMTPAFLIIPVLRYLGRRADRPMVRSAIHALMFAAAGLLVSAMVPLARSALTGPIPIAIAVASFGFLVLTKRSTVWAIVGAAIIGLAAHLS